LDKDVFIKCWKLSGSGVQTQSIQIPDMDCTPDVDQIRIGSGMSLSTVNFTSALEI